MTPQTHKQRVATQPVQGQSPKCVYTYVMFLSLRKGWFVWWWEGVDGSSRTSSSEESHGKRSMSLTTLVR